MSNISQIKAAISENFEDVEVHVLDPQNDGVHLKALVISPEFKEKSLIQQHQMCMQPLKNHFSESLHALGLQTFTPEQWKVSSNKYKLNEPSQYSE